MSKEKEPKESIIKSKFFLKLFGIPYIAWIMLTLVVVITDETDSDPVTLSDFLVTNTVVLLLWSIISFVITIILNEIKKTRPKIKMVKEIQYIDENKDKKVSKSNEIKEESRKQPKKEIKKKTNDGCLYTCDCKIDSYEYKRMVRYFPKIYWAYVINEAFKNLLLSAIIAILSKSLPVTLLFFVVYQIICMILYKVRLEYFAEKSFHLMVKKGISETEKHTEFYDDYFIRQGETETTKIKYVDIDRCIETDTNFYLNYDKKNKIIIIQKNACDLELISFIRNTFENLENHLGDSAKFKGVKSYHHPQFIRRGMLLLFIMTILCLEGALCSVALMDKINPQHGFNFVKNTWVFWCWLPIPILSIILGFKYNNAGFRCTKNIVSGFIMGFLLLLYGSFWLFPTFSEDYDKIDKYKSIIDANLPNNGELEIEDWGTYFDEDKTEYTIINAYYDKEDVSGLVSSIKNSNHWILSKKIKSELRILIPSQLRSDEDAYFSIYNKTTKEYNTLPTEAGAYEIYAMKYDISDKCLEIHQFKYSYQ